MNATLYIIGISLFGAFAIFALVFAVLPEYRGIRQRLMEVGAPKPEEPPWLERVVTKEQRGALQIRLTKAGWHRVKPAQLVLGSIVAGVAVFGLLFLLLVAKHAVNLLSVDVAALLAVAAAYAPFWRLNGDIRARETAVTRALPDLLDMLSANVQAGLAVNAAMQAAAPATPGPLGEELRTALSELRMGRSREDVLYGMANRVDDDEVRDFVRAVITAERLGTNLSELLETLANEARERRIMRAEEYAAQVPVKMTVPMALFMLPALFVVIFGAVAADYFAK